MKRFLFLFILFTTVSQAQEVKTQNDIMQLPNTDLVKDFNLRTKGNIKPTTVTKSTYTDVGFGFVGKKFNYSKKDYSSNILTFKNGKLTSSSSIFYYSFGKPNGLNFYYFYDENGVLKSMTSKSSNAGKLDGSSEKNNYSFNANGIIKETQYTRDGKTTTTQYDYQSNTISYNFANGKTTYHLKNGNITKQVTFNKSANKTYTKSYKYNSKGFLEFEDGGTYTNSYQFNKNNLIEKEIGKNNTKHYKYVYDTFGNWIIAYHLSTSDKNYSGEKTKIHLYGSKFTFYVREIKYSNGDVTGGKTPEHKNIKSALLKVRSELYDELINGKKAYVAKKIRNLDLEFPLHEIEEDYGLKIKGTVVPVQLKKKQYDQRAKRGSTQLATELKIESSQTFDKNLRKVKVSKVTMRGTTTTYNFQYDSQKRLKKYWSVGGRYGDTYENYIYGNNGDFTRTKSFKEGDTGIKSIYEKTDYGYVTRGESSKKIIAENNLVKKIIYGYDKADPSETLINHNENGKVIKRETSFATVINQYNSNGDLKFFKETIKNSGNTTSRSYAYKYDKYGNWIIQVNLLDMSIAKGIPSFPQPTLREITYSNGEKTGTTDISKVENDLMTLRREVKNMSISTDNAVATWKKTAENNFYFYLDSKPVLKAKLAYMGSDILAFNLDNNQLYLMKGIQNAKVNNIYNATKIEVNTSNGFWFKKPKGSVTVFTKDGTVIQKSSLYKYAPNNVDVFYQGEGQPNKVVLRNYKNAQTYKVYPTIPFSQYTPDKINTTTNTNTTAKRSGTCLKGDCDNGYGEFKHTNGYMSEGFFKNGVPYGPMHVNVEAKNESSMAFLKGNYKEYDGMLYRYYGNRYTEMVDYKKQIGVLNDAKERKTYKYNFKNGKAVSKTLLQEKANIGCIVGNCTNGSGVYKYNDGAFYFGTFQNGKYHGFGKLDYKNGNQYIGEFSYGKRHGFGTYIWSEYNYYMGEYQNGKYQGQGVMYYNKSQYNAGNWQDGKFIGSTSNVTTKNTNTTYTNTSSITNTKTTSFNSLSNYDKGSIELCKKNASCVATFFEKLYEKTKKDSNSVITTKKMTDYFHSLYNMNPDMAYRICFKLNGDTFRSIDRESLPQSVQDYLKNRAQNLMNNYKKDMKKKGY